MNTHSSLQYKNFYLLRTPLRTLEELARFHETLNENPEDFANRIFLLFREAQLQEALFIASPALFAEFNRLQEQGEKAAARSVKKMAEALYKYYVRLCTRCTPYGIFAGYALGSWSDSTEMMPDEPFIEKKLSRPDCYLLAEIAGRLLEHDAVRNAAVFYPNNTLYPTASGFRYIEYEMRNSQRHYFLSGFDRSPYTDRILEKAQEGIRLQEAVQLLQQMAIPETDARDFFMELVNARILIPELELPVTGNDFLAMLNGFLQKNAIVLPGTEMLAQLPELLTHRDNGAGLFAAHDLLKKAFPNVNAANPLQTDTLLRFKKNTVAETTIATITENLGRLLHVRQPFRNPDLEAFKRNFIDRYEGEEIPLGEALDPDTGIGYGLYTGENTVVQPLLADLPFAENTREPQNRQHEFVQRLQQLLITALAENKYTVELSDADIQSFNKEPANVPASLYALGSLYRSKDDKDWFELKAMAGPSAANLLGRFCFDYPELAEKVKALLQEEETYHQNILLAEIVHLPQSRIGNILLRPVFRQYEIPLITRASAPQEIPLNDLQVRIQNNRVVLRSRKLNCTVEPRLSTAHNYSRMNIALYKFLSDLQHQDYDYWGKWNWMTQQQEVFLPRVIYKNIVCHKAKWNLNASLFDRKNLPHNTEAEFIRSLETLAGIFRIPEELEMADGDNKLWLNRKHFAAQQLLYKEWKQRRQLVLEECLGSIAQSVVKSGDGHRNNELIIPLLNTAFRAILPENPAPVPAVQRKFPPGSEWCYVKLYCGHQQAEKLLQTHLPFILRTLRERQLFTQWFFIRYNDDGFHLRLRFRNKENTGNRTAIVEVLQQHLRPLIDSREISKMVTDTYVRELERYGQPDIEMAEAVFDADSNASLDVLRFVAENGEAGRWQLALLSAHRYFDLFGCTLPERKQQAEQLYTSFFTEISGEHAVKVKLDQLYRKHQLQAEALLQHSASPLHTLFTERDTAIAAIFRQYNFDAANTQFAGRTNLLHSFIHMSLNRLFTAFPRKNELVIYHHLARYYTSAAARIGK